MTAKSFEDAIRKVIELTAYVDEFGNVWGRNPINAGRNINVLIAEAKVIFENGEIKSSRSFSELENLAEDLECIGIWLDAQESPTHDEHGNKYSHIRRIQKLIQKAQLDAVS